MRSEGEERTKETKPSLKAELQEAQIWKSLGADDRLTKGFAAIQNFCLSFYQIRRLLED